MPAILSSQPLGDARLDPLTATPPLRLRRARVNIRLWLGCADDFGRVGLSMSEGAVQMRRVWYTAAVLTALCLAGCAGAAERRFAAQMKDKPAPDFELTALDGTKVRLSEQRGKPVLLAFFAFG